MTPRALLEPARLAGTPLLRSQTDERLVDLTRAGNGRAFEAIVHRYRRPLLRYCSRLLPAEIAEDTVQHAFVRAYESIRTGDAKLNLRPWLYRIAHNASIDALRRLDRPHEQLSEQIDGVERPDQALERSERLGAVLAAVQALPDRQRSAVVLRELEGRSYDEIATELGVSGGAVRQLLNRARSTLRAGATAVTPGPVAARLAAGGESESVAARVAEIVAPAGVAATLAKVGAAVIVTGAVAGAATDAPLPAVGERDGKDGSAQAAEVEGSDAGPGSGDVLRGETRGDSPGERSGPRGDGDRDRDDDSRRSGDADEDDGDDAVEDGDNSGPGGGDDGDGDNSGPGGGDDGDGDNSGPGSGGDDGIDNSGPGGGGGDDGIDNSGSGGGGDSGSSGSGGGDSGSGGGSGSGSSGSGSGSSGSGSSGSG